MVIELSIFFGVIEVVGLVAVSVLPETVRVTISPGGNLMKVTEGSSSTWNVLPSISKVCRVL